MTREAYIRNLCWYWLISNGYVPGDFTRSDTHLRGATEKERAEAEALAARLPLRSQWDEPELKAAAEPVWWCQATAD